MDAKTKKTVLIAAGVIAAGVVLYYVVKKKTDSSGAIIDPITGGTSTAIFDAGKVAEKLYDAMKESGTDEQAIYSALKNVSASQFDQVFQEFGKRSYNKLLGNQIRVNPFSPLPLEPLNVWLKNELSSDDYYALSLKYNQL